MPSAPLGDFRPKMPRRYGLPTETPRSSFPTPRPTPVAGKWTAPPAQHVLHAETRPFLVEADRVERPAVAATDPAILPRYVVLLPITHTPPAGDTAGIEIPARVSQALGLDDAPSWVIVSEHNIDEWPNAGLSPLPGLLDTFSYGFIPPGLFAQTKARFLELARAKQSRTVRR